jgi:hypothetical protein
MKKRSIEGMEFIQSFRYLKQKEREKREKEKSKKKSSNKISR